MATQYRIASRGRQKADLYRRACHLRAGNQIDQARDRARAGDGEFDLGPAPDLLEPGQVVALAAGDFRNHQPHRRILVQAFDERADHAAQLAEQLRNRS